MKVFYEGRTNWSLPRKYDGMSGAVETAYLRVMSGICIKAVVWFTSFFKDGKTNFSSSMSSGAGCFEGAAKVDKKFQRWDNLRAGSDIALRSKAWNSINDILSNLKSDQIKAGKTYTSAKHDGYI